MRIAYLIIHLLLLFLSQHTQAQQTANKQKASYTAIMDTIARKDIGIDEKYAFTQKISHLPVRERIAIEEAIAVHAKAEADKAKFITLNCMVYNQYSAMGELDTAKTYLDIAAQYKDQTSNVDALGALYYQTGSYYFDKDEEKKAHENFYKAISYYKQSKSKKFFLNFLYYQIGNSYIVKEDVESLSKIVKEMLGIEFDDPYKIYYNNIYSFVASYYQIRAGKEPHAFRKNMRKALYYLSKSIEIYEKYKQNAPNPLTARRMASQNHWTMANIYLKIEPENMEVIMRHFKKGEAYMDKDHESSLAKYHLIKAAIDTEQKKFQKAIDDLKTEEQVQLNQRDASTDRDRTLFSVYKGLSQAYEKYGNYKEALRYAQLKGQVEKRINDVQKYNEIKELNVKYDTAEKELEISKLNKEFEAEQYRRVLSIVGFLLLTTFLTTLFFYERTKKLKKNREALLMADRMKQKDLEHQTFFNETKQRLVRNYLDGLEAERIRLARELHDNVSNQLVVLKMEIERKKELQPIAKSIGDLHTEVRSISHGLMPPVFQYATLSEIIKDYVYQQNLKGTILFTTSISPEEYDWDVIPSELSIEVYRIIQEGIGNVNKHAQALKVDITVEIINNVLLLSVADDGKGFVIGEHKAGLGLRIMEERAAAIGGTLEILSEYSQGTIVKLQVPL